MLVLILEPTVTTIVTPTIEEDAMVQVTTVVEGTAVMVVVKAGDHTIINKGHVIKSLHNRHEPIFLGLHSGNHGSLLFSRILQLEIGRNQALQIVKPTFLGRNHNRHILLQHNRHTHQHMSRMQCILYIWIILISSGTWT